MTTDADWWSILRGLDEPIARPEGIGSEQIFRALVEGSMPETMLSALNERMARGEGDGLEVPRDLDYAATKERFDRLVERLSKVFGCPCESGHPQDSACFGSVWIPAEASRSYTKRTRIRLSLCVQVSNFGRLATYGPSTPSGQTPYVHPDDRQRIEDALAGLGYLIVPERILAAPYDGPNGWVFGQTTNETWSTRFFAHL